MSLPQKLTSPTLATIFGAFGTPSPAPTAGGTTAPANTDTEATADEAPLPDSPETSDHSGLVLVPAARFDGDPDAFPWNLHEAELWDALCTSPIEFIEERVLDGVGGTFWCRVNIGGHLRSCWLKFEDPSGGLRKRWKIEYQLNDDYDLLRREQSAYEIAKALGCEDLVPPLTVRDINPVPLLSDAIRETIARQLRIAPVEVDERLGVAAVLQMCPPNADNFVETWGITGSNPQERWTRCSDRLRHAIFRAYALDFVLGVKDRVLSSFLYNIDTDRLVVTDLRLSFPHPAMVADAYSDDRAQGWGRKNFRSLDLPTLAQPATNWDMQFLVEGMSDKNKDEACATFDQMCDAFTDDVAVHAGHVLAGLGISLQGIAGFLARMAYLRMQGRTLIERPVEFVSNVIVPLRSGYGTDGATSSIIIEYVNSIIPQISNEDADLVSIVQERPAD